MKWLLSTTIAVTLTSTLLFTGCGEDSSDACVYGVQQDLDNGNYDSVITTLDNNGTCDGAMTDSQAKLNLAAAYLGKSGLTMSSLLGAVLDSNSSSAMSSFMTSFASSATSAGLTNIGYSIDTYALVATTAECNTTQTGDKGEACLYSGLATLTKTVGSLSAILGADTLALLSTTVTTGDANDVNSNSNADGLDVTACAIGSTTDATCGGSTSVSYTDASNVTFSKTGFTATTYTPRTFTVTTNTAYASHTEVKLMSTTGIVSPATTSGLCTVDFTACTTSSTTCLPCPVVIDGVASTATTGLLAIINSDDLSSLSSFLPAESNGTDANITSELISSIESASGATADGNVTEADLAAFLLTL